ncbi:MAG: hypothetical protein JWM31_3441 [Solirubrobacterales bacterium]|nr:hypothetical protein [Solirubrobacterales bacterium]
MTNCLRTVDKPATDMGESGMADAPMRISPDGRDLAIRNRDYDYFPWRVTDGSQRADKQVADWLPLVRADR